MERTERIAEIEARVAEINGIMEGGEYDLDALTAEMETLTEERAGLQAEVEKRARLAEMVAAGMVGTPVEKEEPVMANERETRADLFRQNGKLELRTLLGTGDIAKPAQVGGVYGLGEVASSIVDDVNAIALTGNGAWIAAYKDSDAVAAAVTDGDTIGGTAATFKTVTINPAEWGVLDAISNQVKKLTSLDYMTAIERSAVIGLRKYAAEQIITGITGSDLKQEETVALDANYLRSLMFAYRSIEGKGDVFLYINPDDIATLGNVRGTNEKRPLYTFTFDQGTTTSGVISEGGLAVRFRVLDGLTKGTQLFGQPGNVDMPMWDQYEVAIDEGGEYFQKNLIGIRGLQTANAALVAKNGMIVVTQGA